MAVKERVPTAPHTICAKSSSTATIARYFPFKNAKISIIFRNFADKVGKNPQNVPHSALWLSFLPDKDSEFIRKYRIYLCIKKIMRARTGLLSLFLLWLLPLWAEAKTTETGIGTVVIDAGHGGRLPGAHYGGLYEKDIVLKVALKLGKMIEEGMPEVKVVYTRKSDVMLGETLAEDLQRRADIANQAGGELFISIHANAARSTSANGIEVLVMGETPKEQQYNTSALLANNREELIDLDTEPNAPIVRARIQNLQFTYGEYSMATARCIERSFREAGRVVRRTKPQLLRVLYATDMPGVLVEIGFMSNATDFAHMKSDKGLTGIARNLYRAVEEYSKYLLTTRTGAFSPQPIVEQQVKQEEEKQVQQVENPAEQPAQEQPAPVKATAPATAKQQQPTQAPLHYTVQVLSLVKKISLNSSELKEYRGKAKCYIGTDGRYKYGVGEFETRAEAQRTVATIRKSFPGAFVVCCRGDKIVKIK